MKLSVVFLLCFVATTYQHHLRNYHFYEPRLAFYYPLLSNQQFGFHDSDMDDEADYTSISSPTGDFPDAEARRPISRFGNGNRKTQSRFFGMNNFISQLLNNKKNQYHLLPTITSIITQTSTSTLTTSSITFTSTILQTSTSTVPTTWTKSCINLAQFANSPADALKPALTPAVTSTQPCRRRRGINLEEIEAIQALRPVPTPVEVLETSVAPPVMELSSRDKRINKHQPEIVSSQDQPIDEEENNGINYRQKRLPS